MKKNTITYTDKETNKYCFIDEIKDTGITVFQINTVDNTVTSLGEFNAHDFGQRFRFSGWQKIDTVALIYYSQTKEE